MNTPTAPQEPYVSLYTLAYSEVLVKLADPGLSAADAILSKTPVEVESVETGKRWKVSGFRLRPFEYVPYT